MNHYIHTPEWSTLILEKFINCLMQWWKKSVARRIMSDCFEELKKLWHAKPQDAFHKAIQQISPNIEVKPKRVGWAVYQVPVPVSEKRQLFLAIRWILDAARKKKWIPMSRRLSAEINDSLWWAWDAFKKKEEVHKMAQANKAFAHFARVL